MVLAVEATANSGDPDDDDDDDAGRLFTFKVKKTREEQENVIASDGFQAWPYHPTTGARLLNRLLFADVQPASRVSAAARRVRGAARTNTSPARFRRDELRHHVGRLRAREG